MNIKELAEQAGISYLKYINEEQMKLVELFAELVAADAVAKEREACAKLAENIVSNKGYVQASYVAAAIRARSKHD